jgi:glycerol-3-phosphate acyltransferase PlsX
MIRIAVDAMGGDHAPSAVIEGAVSAARHLAVRIALVGPAAVLHEALASHPDWPALGLDIIEAPDVVEMAEAPAAALCRKPRASIRVAADLVAQNEAGALFSAGHIGATVMAAYAAFGMIPGVDRPALAATIPTRANPAVLVDAGANVEFQFAVMGGVYARVALGIDRPRVGLLSIGEEETKGNELSGKRTGCSKRRRSTSSAMSKDARSTAASRTSSSATASRATSC